MNIRFAQLETTNSKLQTNKELTATGIAPELHRTSLLMITLKRNQPKSAQM